MIWKRETTVKELNNWCENTLVEHLDIKITNVNNSSIEATMPVSNKVKQPHGLMHGGASCVLAESIGSIASNLCISDEYRAVGSNIETKHIRPVRSGNVLGIANPVHIGKRSHIWEVKITDESDRLISITLLTTAIVRA